MFFLHYILSPSHFIKRNSEGGDNIQVKCIGIGSTYTKNPVEEYRVTSVFEKETGKLLFVEITDGISRTTHYRGLRFISNE